MNSKITIAAAAFGLLTSGAAFADIELGFDYFTADGGVFMPIGEVEGTLLHVIGLFHLEDDGQNFTYANDLTVLFRDAAGNAVVQIGGWTSQGNPEVHLQWEYGNTWYEGTEGGGDIDVNFDVTGLTMHLGNGYNNGGLGIWSGDILLTGINYTEVPAPGALALLGLAGIASRRRRK